MNFLFFSAGGGAQSCSVELITTFVIAGHSKCHKTNSGGTVLVEVGGAEGCHGPSLLFLLVSIVLRCDNFGVFAAREELCNCPRA